MDNRHVSSVAAVWSRGGFGLNLPIQTLVVPSLAGSSESAAFRPLSATYRKGFIRKFS